MAKKKVLPNTKRAKKKVKKKAKKAKIRLTLDDLYDLQEQCQSVIGTGEDVVQCAEGAVSEWKRIEPALNKLCTAINSTDLDEMAAAAAEVRKEMGEAPLDLGRLDDGDDFKSELRDLLSNF